MTFMQIICVIGSFAIFVLVAWWCANYDCNNNSQWQKAIDKMTEEKFPYMWKETRPTIDKYVMQKLIELEQEVKELKDYAENEVSRTMTKEDFIKIGEDSIRCDECAFCEDCEDRFTQCVANYQHEGKPVHLKSCEYLQWNTMSDESKAFFLQECLPHEYKCKS